MAPPTKPPCDELPTCSRDPVLFRLGYLQSTCDRILHAVTARPQATPAASTARTSGLGDLWGRIKEALTLASLLHRAWQMVKLVPWVGMGIEGVRLFLRLLGLR